MTRHEYYGESFKDWFIIMGIPILENAYHNETMLEELKNIIKLTKSKDSTIQDIGIELYKEYIK